MRISDWSSDVCSTDLLKAPVAVPVFVEQRRGLVGAAFDRDDMLSAGNGLDERIVAETAEIAGEAFEIVVAHPLIGESEDVMVEPGGADVGDGLGGERAGEEIGRAHV